MLRGRFANLTGALTGTILAAAFVGLVLLSGFDRLADRDDSALPAVTNWAYPRNAAFNAANAAGIAHQWGNATTLIARALATDPLNEGVIGRLGKLRLMMGDKAGADAAFRVSAQRGWRDPDTHLYWISQSIDAGDFNTAALHADGLLRGSITDGMRNHIFDLLLEYDEGRNALAAHLRNHPVWAQTIAYTYENMSDDELTAHADVIARTGPGVWTCQETGPLIDRLLEAGHARDALVAHEVTCPQNARQAGSGNSVHDARFVQYLTEPHASQLDWFSPDSANGEITPATNVPAHGGVQVTSARGVTEMVLSQHVVIEPGLYTLAWQMPGTDQAAVASLVADLSCESDLARATAATAVPGRPGTVAVNVRFAGSCPAPVIAFWLRPTGKSVTIDRVTLNRTGN